VIQIAGKLDVLETRHATSSLQLLLHTRSTTLSNNQPRTRTDTCHGRQLKTHFWGKYWQYVLSVLEIFWEWAIEIYTLLTYLREALLCSLPPSNAIPMLGLHVFIQGIFWLTGSLTDLFIEWHNRRASQTNKAKAANSSSKSTVYTV